MYVNNMRIICYIYYSRPILDRIRQPYSRFYSFLRVLVETLGGNEEK